MNGLHPELKALDRLHLSVIRAVEIGLRSANVRMAQQTLNSSNVISIIQQGGSERMPHHVGMNPFLDQCLFCGRFDQAINSLGCKGPFIIGSMLPQGIEYGMVGVDPIPTGFQIILDGE